MSLLEKSFHKFGQTTEYSHHTYVFYPLKAELGNILILMNYFTLVLEFHLFSVPKLHSFAIFSYPIKYLLDFNEILVLSSF